MTRNAFTSSSIISGNFPVQTYVRDGVHIAAEPVDEYTLIILTAIPTTGKTYTLPVEYSPMSLNSAVIIDSVNTTTWNFIHEGSTIFSSTSKTTNMVNFFLRPGKSFSVTHNKASGTIEAHFYFRASYLLETIVI